MDLASREIAGMGLMELTVHPVAVKKGQPAWPKKYLIFIGAFTIGELFVEEGEKKMIFVYIGRDGVVEIKTRTNEPMAELRQAIDGLLFKKQKAN